MSRVPVGGYLPIEIQMLAEMAASLREAARSLEGTLARLELLRDELLQLGPAGPAANVAEYRRLRAEAERQRWNLIVQREAIGFRPSDDVYEHYPLPPALPDPPRQADPPPPPPVVGDAVCPACGRAVAVRGTPSRMLVGCSCGACYEVRCELGGGGPYRAQPVLRVLLLALPEPSPRPSIASPVWRRLLAPLILVVRLVTGRR